MMIAGYEHRFEPAPDAASAPTLLLLHGTGGDENDLLPLGRLILPGANLLSPRGNAPENGMPRFFRRLAEGVFDQEDMQRRTGELGRFIAESAPHYGFDPGRVIAVGYSNGANIAASLLLREPGRLAAAILLHPMVPFEPETPPDLAGKPIFISAGRNDPIVPQENTRRLAAVFQSGGAEVALTWHDAGHSLTQAEITSARDWLAEHGPL
jgi:phospholipase/carboxylesterase/glyoxalase family protein